MYEDYKPIPFWSWNDKLEENKLVKQIRWMKEHGFGGFFMHARGGLDTEYLSKEWFDCIKACCTEAKKLGMSAWAYDENGWPSGFVGGKLLEKEENHDRYLSYSIGSYDASALVSYDISGEELVRITKADLPIEHCLNVYEHISVSNADILNKEVVDQFIAQTHEKYKCQLGKEFSTLTAGFFTDEPQYQREYHPYTRVLPAYYYEKYKEDLLNGLGHMFVEKKDYRVFRYRYWLCMQELMLSAFAKNIYEWCEENGVKLTGHYFEESSVTGQMMGCAGVMPFYEYEHIPGIDRLGKNGATPIAAKQAASVARQLGKKQVLTETFAGCGWNVTPQELKRIAEQQYVLGVNLMCHHLVPYSEVGQRKRDYPVHFSTVTPWVRKDLKTFNDYFSKLGYLLGESEEIVKVGVFCPIRSRYFHYKREAPSANNQIGYSYRETLVMLSARNISYHILDETILEKYAVCEGARLQVGNCVYDTVVFPKTETMSKQNYQLLKQFYENGGRILFLEGIPEYIEGEPFAYDVTSNITLEEVQKAEEYTIDKFDTEILSTLHRDAEGRYFLYVVNTSEKKSYTVTFKGDFKSFYGLEIETETYYKQSATMKLRPGQSKILYYSQEAVNEEMQRQEIILPETMEVLEASDNYMTLDRLSVSYDGVTYGEEESYTKVFNRLLEEQYEGDLWLKYTFDIKTVPKRISFLTEDMNKISCAINGQEMQFDGVSDFEERISRADVASYCVEGNNEIVIKIHFFERESVYYALFGEGVTESLQNCIVYDTTIEACYLQGDFGVYSTNGFKSDAANEIYFCNGDFYIDKRELIVSDTIRQGYPFFAGNMTVKIPFESDGGPCSLRLPKNAHLSYLKVNGVSVEKGYFEDKPDISQFVKKGVNVAEITVYSGNRNLLGPHHYLPDPEPQMVNPQMFDFILGYKNGECRQEGQSYSFVPFLK